MPFLTLPSCMPFLHPGTIPGLSLLTQFSLTVFSFLRQLILNVALFDFGNVTCVALSFENPYLTVLAPNIDLLEMCLRSLGRKTIVQS